MNSFSNDYKRRRTRLFIGRNEENRPISLINGRDETVHRGPFQLSHDRQIEDGRPGCDLPRCVIKRMKQRPLDRNLTLQMRLIA